MQNIIFSKYTASATHDIINLFHPKFIKSKNFLLITLQSKNL